MNAAITDKTALIIKHAQPQIRDDLSRIISGCNFTDPDDPTLNALVVQALLAGQPIKLVEQRGSSVATEAGLARLGDRIDKVAWSLARMKISTVLLACLLCIFIGAGGSLLAIKSFSGTAIGRYLGLSNPVDARIESLNRIGAALQVTRKENTIYVFFKGDHQPQAGQTKDGLNILYFRQ